MKHITLSIAALMLWCNAFAQQKNQTAAGRLISSPTVKAAAPLAGKAVVKAATPTATRIITKNTSTVNQVSKTGTKAANTIRTVQTTSKTVRNAGTVVNATEAVIK